MPNAANDPAPTRLQLVPLIAELNVDTDTFTPYGQVQLVPPAAIAALFPNDDREA